MIMVFNNWIGRGLSCLSKIICGLTTIIEIKVNYHKDLASMNNDLFKGQTDWDQVSS
jgi:hypothetical protein